MNAFERQVKQAQHRLWVNRWLRLWGWALLMTAALWTLAWIVDRLFFPGMLPVARSAGAGLVASLVVSLGWLVFTREPPITAAAALDEAAGLRERVSTSLQIQPNPTEPFAKAVVADAQRAMAGLSARRFIPIRWAGSLSLSSAMILVALASTLLPEFDLLSRNQAKADEARRLDHLEKVRSVVAKPVSVMRQIAEKYPDIKLDDQNRLDDPLGPDRPLDADVLRRQAVKKLDRLQDALRERANSDRLAALKETKKRLERLGEPSDPKNELGRLMGALSSGDFKEAQQAAKKLQENLAKRVRDGSLDPETAKRLQQQLEGLAQKLQQAARDEKSQRELQNAGLSEAEAKRILEALSKKDPKQLKKLAEQLAKRLKDQGVSQKQIQEMLKKIQQRRQGAKQCKKLGDKMAGAARQLERGDTQAAQGELGEAGEMLSEMEQLEQALSELDAEMSQLDDLRDDLSQGDQEGGKCKQCKGTGFRRDGAPCPWCNGSGR